MIASFIDPPQTETFCLRNATLPAICVPGISGPSREGLVRADIVISDGRIAMVATPGAASPEIEAVDLKGAQVWPAFTDMHTHLDKGHIWGRRPNPDGSFEGALEAVRGDRDRHWSAEDVRARMDFSLRCAYAHGTRLIRTHLDSLGPQHRISWPVFAEMREAWKGRIDLQAAALIPLDATADKAWFDELVGLIVECGGLLGGLTRMGPNLEAELDLLFRTAIDNGLDIDLHVDETADAEVRTLAAIAEAALRHKYEGQVVVGHCCSLARQDADTAARTIDKVAEAGLAVVSLPMCNMYLQDRNGGTPSWRGVTLFKELAAAGVATAVSSDNTRDPFYAYGDLDPAEVFREAVRILHLDHPLDEAARVVTRTPALILRRPELGVIEADGPADLVIFRARDWSELLSRPQSDRVVLRDGRAIDRTLPDYSELDHLLECPK
ncbi:cytosine deaminase [Chelativorans sp. ZYF759]|uniref:cytosine deaminase n=1 Tax=Chelativorans sp. ZYF759 TaxID=2692213 RepID=UPI00145DB071|nr:cytosine deaminase [Chelativorans sp. ZYF759]NMG41561.1 cytosine deaminase [Chelativorans sp. ZYF759]